MPRRETVAVVTMLCDQKDALIPMLTPRWDAIDFGDREVVYIAVANDANQQTRDAFSRSTKRQVLFVTVPDMDALVPALEHERDVRDSETHSNVIYLHRMAMLREGGRQAALELRLGGDDESEGEPVDWVFWLDSDIDPREHGFQCLHEVLTLNTGPQAPRVAAGLYCTRHWGHGISQWVDEGGRRYMALVKDQVQASRVAGFGCVLMRRETLEQIEFGTYGDYRAERAWQCEVVRKGSAGVYGEDVWWFRQYERWCGVPPMVDNRVRCRHYHDDGSYWRYVETPDGLLEPEYVTDEVLPGAGVYVRNRGARVIRLDSYNLALQPGAECCVSTEIANTLRANFAQDVEIAA